VNTPELLFEKIEDTAIEYQVDKLLQTKLKNASPAGHIIPQRTDISYDDFSRLDLRTATIIAAEKVPKTKKLLKLLVDTGIDQRIIVSGIAAYYSPEEIVGRKVSVLINLAPREIKGIVSSGMILMAENSAGKLCFVSPIEDFDNGSAIK
ncbi:MAG: methionine--tRNA ligase subunit beta, partial [Bacteroidales bacterium]|nr:methionine--tRNA ligase subunit beta [Bacteroidales bacterium]